MERRRRNNIQYVELVPNRILSSHSPSLPHAYNTRLTASSNVNFGIFTLPLYTSGFCWCAWYYSWGDSAIVIMILSKPTLSILSSSSRNLTSKRNKKKKKSRDGKLENSVSLSSCNILFLVQEKETRKTQSAPLAPTNTLSSLLLLLPFNCNIKHGPKNQNKTLKDKLPTRRADSSSSLKTGTRS